MKTRYFQNILPIVYDNLNRGLICSLIFSNYIITKTARIWQAYGETEDRYS